MTFTMWNPGDGNSPSDIRGSTGLPERHARLQYSDHARMAAMLTVENVLESRPAHDTWRVDEHAEYLEDEPARTAPSVVHHLTLMPDSW